MKQGHCSLLCLRDKNSESSIIDEVVIALTLGRYIFQLLLEQGARPVLRECGIHTNVGIISPHT